jgi:hypothetical protein
MARDFIPALGGSIVERPEEATHAAARLVFFHVGLGFFWHKKIKEYKKKSMDLWGFLTGTLV